MFFLLQESDSVYFTLICWLLEFYNFIIAVFAQIPFLSLLQLTSTPVINLLIVRISDDEDIILFMNEYLFSVHYLSDS